LKFPSAATGAGLLAGACTVVVGTADFDGVVGDCLADGALEVVVPPVPPDPATGPVVGVLDVTECFFDFADRVSVPHAVAIRDSATPSVVDFLRRRPPATAWPTGIPAEAYC